MGHISGAHGIAYICID